MSTRTLGDNASFLPRGFRREDAAFYIGVSPAMFDEMVKDGRMPQPKRVGRRTIWDRQQLDVCFEELPDRGDGNDWDEVVRSKVRNENQD
jgi:predicted DNA-binding transcriptional regulator AlpA